MSETPEIKRGDIVTVHFSTDPDQSDSEPKLAIVVQNDIGNTQSSATVIALVTDPYIGHPFEVRVSPEESPYDRELSVRLDQIRTVSIEDRIDSVIGSLGNSTMANVDDALKVSLGLD